MPKLPSQAEIEEGRRKRALEAEELAKKEPSLGTTRPRPPHNLAAPPSCTWLLTLRVPPRGADERIEMAMEAKARGNELVAQGDMMEAKKAYDEGFVRVFFSREEWEGGLLTDEEKAKVNRAKVRVHRWCVLTWSMGPVGVTHGSQSFTWCAVPAAAVPEPLALQPALSRLGQQLVGREQGGVRA